MADGSHSWRRFKSWSTVSRNIQLVSLKWDVLNSSVQETWAPIERKTENTDNIDTSNSSKALVRNKDKTYKQDKQNNKDKKSNQDKQGKNDKPLNKGKKVP